MTARIKAIAILLAVAGMIWVGTKLATCVNDLDATIQNRQTIALEE